MLNNHINGCKEKPFIHAMQIFETFFHKKAEVMYKHPPFMYKSLF